MIYKNNYHHGKLKEAILREAIEQLKKDGIEKISFRSIAKEVGVASSAPYNHFDNKQQLLHVISDLGRTMLLDNMNKGRNKSIYPSEQLTFLAKEYLLFASEETHIFELMFSRYNLGYKDLVKDINSLFEQVINKIFKVGNRKRVTSVGASATAWAMVHGLAVISNSGGFYGLDNKENLEYDDIFIQMSAIWGKGVV